ncbi:acyl carrier protein [Streptoalloteichus hindustanus]|uniref:acyl carrier protein n=1 Tax=Streptoalloteichus hindustanus TaxID=2017 RepID=UPI0013563D6E|nr:acyl carrier protein [Streptoalloteichus hindustanus]
MTEGKRDRVREIVLELAELDDGALDETSRFVEDCGIDSMTLVEIVAAVEREYALVFEEDQIRRMVNLAALREVFAEALARR